MKFYYSDGQSVCLYNDGKISKYPSKFIEKYKENAINIQRNQSWKHGGEGARFRGDTLDGEVRFQSSINGIFPDETQVVYSFTVNGTSGIYKFDPSDEKAEEVHVINSLDNEFEGGTLDTKSGNLAVALKRNYYNTDIAVFDTESGDYKVMTEGDTRDEDPYISPDDGNIVYFSSRGAGRNSSGEFVDFSPAAICKINLSALNVEEVLSSPKYNYLRPVYHGGKLYVLRTPLKEKGPNPFIEILLIPVRIVQAIANFINVFVRAFTGKSLASGGDNPAKGRDYDSRKEYIKGNLINVEKEEKRNRKKSGEYGFIPLTWQIIEAESGEVIKSGVADYDILPDGTFISTDGKHVYATKDGKSKKLCDAELCLKVAACHSSEHGAELFGKSDIFF